MHVYSNDWSSSESAPKRKPAAKPQRKWGDQPPSETEMASLDFSVDKLVSDDNNAHPQDVKNLVNQSSIGTRTRDGFYEVKDWEFDKEKQTNEIIAQALTAKEPATSSTSGSLGALGSLFARLTGSKILTEKDLQPVLEGMKQHLMKKNVAREISEKICESVGESLIGKKVGGFQSD